MGPIGAPRPAPAPKTRPPALLVQVRSLRGGLGSGGAAQPAMLTLAPLSSVGGLGYNYYCEFSTPPAAVPSGSGVLCYANETACWEGTNACTPSDGRSLGEFSKDVTLWGGKKAASSIACVVRNDICSTGQAGGTGNVFVCPGDFPTGSKSNGAGSWCYDTPENCLQGTNACNSSLPCVADASTCAVRSLRSAGTSAQI
jgi:hypothetical protein